MSDMLQRIRRELQQRLDSTRAAAQEHERVRSALEALEHAVAPLERVARRATGGGSEAKRGSAAHGPSDRAQGGSAATGSRTTPARSPATAARRATGSRKPTARARSAATAEGRSAAKPGGRARAGARPARARAPRGANREAVLAVVRERPGVTARELAAASGVTGGTLYALLRRLTAQGELAKRDLPGGQTGYALATSDAPVTGAARGRTIDEDGSSARTEDAVTAEHEGASPGNRP